MRKVSSFTEREMHELVWGFANDFDTRLCIDLEEIHNTLRELDEIQNTGYIILFMERNIAKIKDKLNVNREELGKLFAYDFEDYMSEVAKGVQTVEGMIEDMRNRKLEKTESKLSKQYRNRFNAISK